MPEDNFVKKIGKTLLLIAPVVFLSIAIYSFGIFNKAGETLKAEEKPSVKGASTIPTLPYIEKVLNLPPETNIISQDKTLCGIRMSLRSKSPADKILSYYLSQMPDSGWNISSSDTEKIGFKKENKDLEIRILEKEENETLVEVKLTIWSLVLTLYVYNVQFKCYEHYYNYNFKK